MFEGLTKKEPFFEPIQWLDVRGLSGDKTVRYTKEPAFGRITQTSLLDFTVICAISGFFCDIEVTIRVPIEQLRAKHKLTFKILNHYDASTMQEAQQVFICFSDQDQLYPSTDWSSTMTPKPGLTPSKKPQEP